MAQEETWQQWQKRKLTEQKTEKRRNRVGHLTIKVEIDLPCLWQTWGDDVRYERCMRHGEVRRADRISDNPCVQWWGRGPEGERCATCKHLVRMEQARVWFKCRQRSDLTHSSHTDQRVGWEACARWELNPDFKKGGS